MRLLRPRAFSRSRNDLNSKRQCLLPTALGVTIGMKNTDFGDGGLYFLLPKAAFGYRSSVLPQPQFAAELQSQLTVDTRTRTRKRTFGVLVVPARIAEKAYEFRKIGQRSHQATAAVRGAPSTWATICDLNLVEQICRDSRPRAWPLAASPAPMSTRSISDASSAGAFEPFTRFDTGHIWSSRSLPAGLR